MRFSAKLSCTPRWAAVVVGIAFFTVWDASSATSDAVSKSLPDIASDRANRHFVIASSNNFPPINQINEDGQLVGFGSDIANAVVEAVGGTGSHIHSSIWGDVLNWLAEGRADFIHDTGFSIERTAFLDYSDPILTMPEEIFVRADHFDIADLKSIKDRKVACVDKHITHIYLMTLPAIKCHIVATPVDGLYALLNGDVVAFVFPRQVLLHIAQRLDVIDRIKVVGNPIRDLTWHMTVRKGDQEMLDVLNQGIVEIKANGEYDRIYDHWFGRIAFSGYSQKELMIIIAAVAALSALVVLTVNTLRMARVQQRLNNSLNEQKQTEQALRESDTRFRDFAEVSADWLWETDENLRFTYFSEGFKDVISGRSTIGDFLGKTRLELVASTDENVEKWRKHMEDMEARKLIRDFTYTYVAPHGENIYFSVDGNPVFDEQQNFMGYRGAGHNITDKVLNDEKIRASEERLRLIFESAAIPLAVIRLSDSVVLFANSAWLELFGRATEDIASVRMEDLYVDIKLRHDFLKKLEAEGRVQGMVAQFKRKNGETFYASYNSFKTIIDNEDVVISGLLDITERTRADEELKNHRDHLEDLVAARTSEVQEKAAQLESALMREKEYNALQKKFVALVSHEFRTPLTIIDSTAQRLIRRKSKLNADDIETRANKVRSAVTRMIGLIDTTLYTSQLDAGKIEAQLAPGDIGELLLDVCKRQAEIAPDHKFKVEVEDLPNKMQIDTRLLDQVFTNLLSNAVKYAPQSPHIEVQGRQENGDVLINVTDHGVGIPEDELPHIFGRFFRASTSEGFSGTGLGLNLCKELVEMHGGTITIDSVEGSGSTFTIRIPINVKSQKVS